MVVFGIVILWIIEFVNSVGINQGTYYGCYVDKGKRALPGWGGQQTSVDGCSAACRKDGFTFAGIQNGGQCWCGEESYSKYGIDFRCYDGTSKKCADDAVNVCGGAWANSVYKVCNGNFHGRNCDLENRACGNRGAHVSGDCLSKCPPGWKGYACDQECAANKFGTDCEEDCTDRCVNSKCDSKIGYCLDGCKAGFGPFCLSSCQGSSKPTGPCPFCGHCKDSVCAGSGVDCYYRCPSKWKGDVCQDCDYDLWGPRCENKCSVNCVSSCNAKNGHCVDGCKLGYHGDRCDMRCPTNCPNNQCTQEDGYCLSCDVGIFGHTCDKTCGNCSHEGCRFPGGECNDCILGYYSANCDQPCPEGCTIEGCDQTSGACMNCPPGYYGMICNETCVEHCDICDKNSGACTICETGYYGENCTNMCGNCSNLNCNKQDGHCSPCNTGYHGQLCKLTCPPNCHGDTCDINDVCNICNQTSGHCFKCQVGYYGDNCTARCPENCTDGRCAQNNGHCTSNCKHGYYGGKCDRRCSNCLTGKCERSGECIDGCLAGFTGLKCVDFCATGTFGGNCSLECHCAGGAEAAACDAVSGHCAGGECAEGWTGDSCQLADPQGVVNVVAIVVPLVVFILLVVVVIIMLFFIWRKRNLKKSKTNNMAKSNDSEYSDVYANKSPISDKSKDYGPYEEVVTTQNENLYENPDEMKQNIEIKSGSYDSGFTEEPQYSQVDETKKTVEDQNIVESDTAELLYAQVHKPGKQKSKAVVDDNKATESQKESSEHAEVDASLFKSTADSPTADDISKNLIPGNTQKPKLDAPPDTTNTTDAQAQLTLQYKNEEVTEPSLETISESSSKPISEAKAWNETVDTNNNGPETSSEFPNKSHTIENNINQESTLNCSEEKFKKETAHKIPKGTAGEIKESASEEYDEDYGDTLYRSVNDKNQLTKKIGISEMESAIRNLEKDDGFLKEYEKLNHNKQSPWTVAENPKLKTKNRYKSIIAYDHSRVVLAQIGDDPLTDYINANYIPSYNRQFSYIASQGVTRHNYEDFWRMIMEKGIIAVVMLTQISENNKTKCLQYWPSKGSITAGSVKVSLVSESLRADCVIRVLKAESGEVSRTVTQYHYTDWPDHNVPVSPRQLVNLRWRVKRQTEGSTAPVLVHCSAGIGRTGTFLAVDRLLDEAADTGIVDVPAAVNTLRQDRINMVQNVHQYEFVYRAVLEGLTVGRSTVHVDEFATYVQNLQEDQVKAQFDTIMNTPKTDDDEQNKHNDIKLPFLKNCYSYVKMPNEKEVEGFWRKISSERNRVIIYCSNGDIELSTDNTWLPKEEHSLQLPNTTIKLAKDLPDCQNCYSDIVIETHGNTEYYNVKSKVTEPSENGDYMECCEAIEMVDKGYTVRLYRIVPNFTWNASMYGDIKDVIGDSSVIVTGGDDASAGVCIMTLLLMEQANVHQEVDVMDTAIALQQALPGALKSVESFKELLDATASMLNRRNNS